MFCHYVTQLIFQTARVDKWEKKKKKADLMQKFKPDCVDTNTILSVTSVLRWTSAFASSVIVIFFIYRTPGRFCFHNAGNTEDFWLYLISWNYVWMKVRWRSPIRHYWPNLANLGQDKLMPSLFLGLFVCIALKHHSFKLYFSFRFLWSLTSMIFVLLTLEFPLRCWSK